MYVCGHSIDNISLLALTLAVGFVVDDAIVMLENIVRHIEGGMKPMEAAFKGSKEVSFTIVSMTLSLVAVFIPVLFMGGVVGRMFNEFGLVISMAIDVDDASNLVCVDCGTTQEIRYVYDANNRRVARTMAGETTYYVTSSSGDLLMEYTPSKGQGIEHIYVHGKRIATRGIRP